MHQEFPCFHGIQVAMKTPDESCRDIGFTARAKFPTITESSSRTTRDVKLLFDDVSIFVRHSKPWKCLLSEPRLAKHSRSIEYTRLNRKARCGKRRSNSTYDTRNQTKTDVGWREQFEGENSRKCGREEEVQNWHVKKQRQSNKCHKVNLQLPGGS